MPCAEHSSKFDACVHNYKIHIDLIPFYVVCIRKKNYDFFRIFKTKFTAIIPRDSDFRRFSLTFIHLLTGRNSIW